VSMLLSLLSALTLKAFGWKLAGGLPQHSHLIMIVSPHTSNWDFPVVMLFKWKLRLQGNYLGKHTLFSGPLGWFMRATGGTAVIRDENHQVVDQVAQIFRARRRFWLGIAPAGTRSYTEHWRSGFYRMALAAKVEIMPVRLDFSRKLMTIGEPFMPSGEVVEDMDLMRKFFKGAMGCRPDKMTPVRLRAEKSTESL
jgi:1-acyl-sn-glycerol-3-phosphate acyltransferase